MVIGAVIMTGAVIVAVAVALHSRRMPTTAAAIPGEHLRGLACDDRSIDFGRRFRPLDPIEHTFVVQNRSTMRLKLNHPSSSCTCTVGELSREELAPGETATVHVTWHVPNRVGGEAFAIYMTGEPASHVGRLMLRGRVRIADRLVLRPTDVGVLKVQQGASIHRSIDFTAPEGLTVPRNIRIACDAPEENLRCELRRTPEGGSIEITCVGQPALGRRDYVISIGSDDPDLKQLTVPVTVENVPPFELQPAFLLVNPSREGLQGSWVRVVSHTGAVPEVDRVESDDTNLIDVKSRRGEGGIQEVGVLPLPVTSTDRRNGVVKVYLKGIIQPLDLPYIIVNDPIGGVPR
jgi:hypothetical protein